MCNSLQENQAAWKLCVQETKVFVVTWNAYRLGQIFPCFPRNPEAQLFLSFACGQIDEAGKLLPA